MSGTHERRLPHPKEEGATCTLAHFLRNDRCFGTEGQRLMKRRRVVIPALYQEKGRDHVLREIPIQAFQYLGDEDKKHVKEFDRCF